jgi:hypothetical protein
MVIVMNMILVSLDVRRHFKKNPSLDDKKAVNQGEHRAEKI